jgi:hypothetical protein
MFLVVLGMSQVLPIRRFFCAVRNAMFAWTYLLLLYIFICFIIVLYQIKFWCCGLSTDTIINSLTKNINKSSNPHFLFIIVISIVIVYDMIMP